MRRIPAIDDVARRNPRFDPERAARFERLTAELQAERPRYRVDPPLGDLVRVSGQELVSAARRKA